MNENTNTPNNQNTRLPQPAPENKKPVEVIVDLIDPQKPGVLFEALLKKPLSLAVHLQKQSGLGRLNLSLVILVALSLLLYGLVIGSYSAHEQLWAAPVKILLGTVFSALICFPSLYIFTCLTGSETSGKVLISGLLATLALMGVLLIGFAPILWVFSQSTHALGFMGFLMLLSWMIAFIFAMGFLYKLLNHAGAERLSSVKVWAGIFLLVSLQMSTSLRPIIGRSDDLLTNEKRFFIQHWVEVGSETTEYNRESDNGR